MSKFSIYLEEAMEAARTARTDIDRVRYLQLAQTWRRALKLLEAAKEEVPPNDRNDPQPATHT